MFNQCIFCKIIKEKKSAQIVGETDLVLAFRDINPQASTHILIIPKIHIQSTNDLNKSNIHYLSDMLLLANKISIKEKINKSGYRWVVNTGFDAGQTVNHLHLHLIGGRKMQWPPG